MDCTMFMRCRHANDEYHCMDKFGKMDSDCDVETFAAKTRNYDSPYYILLENDRHNDAELYVRDIIEKKKSNFYDAARDILREYTLVGVALIDAWDAYEDWAVAICYPLENAVQHMCDEAKVVHGLNGFGNTTEGFLHRFKGFKDFLHGEDGGNFVELRHDCLNSSDEYSERWRTIDSDFYVDVKSCAKTTQQNGYWSGTGDAYQYEFEFHKKEDLLKENCKHTPCFLEYKNRFGCEEILCSDVGYGNRNSRITCPVSGNGNAGWVTVPEKADILAITANSGYKSCGLTACGSNKLENLEYTLKYDPIVEQVEQLTQIYEVLTQRTMRKPPFQMFVGNTVVLPGTIIAIKGWDGKYCSVTDKNMKCNQDNIGEFEKFVIEDAGMEQIAFKSDRSQKYCSVATLNRIHCSSDSLSESGKYIIVGLPKDGTFGFHPANSEQFCSDQGNYIKCYKPTIQKKEEFTAELVSHLATPAPVQLDIVVCPAGYDSIGEDLAGEGQVSSMQSLLPMSFDDCATECDNRDGCTAFEYAAFGVCNTYTGGDENIKEQDGRTDPTSTWYSCVKSEASETSLAQR